MSNTASPKNRQSFRADINGLRAWAVVAVVLYHFEVPGFSGGFVGVDMFFVISGFLMTGIIFDGLERSMHGGRSFSLLRFYLARARRIVPALVVLCSVTLLLGWFTLPPVDYLQLGTHVVSALTFVSNIKFRRETGYFDVASHEKWLLHTWSLSVEWQFYLILPLILMGLWRLRPSHRVITGGLFVGFLATLALSVILTPRKPEASFYLLYTRAWEMLAGGLVFMLANRLTLNARSRNVIELIGFAMILVAIGFVDTSMEWPGWRALLPVIGSMLVLIAARVDSAWTATRISQWFGNASYSIYLWHWPVVVTLAYTDLLGKPSAVAVGLLLSLLLGFASYRWVEQTSRERLAMWQWKQNVTVIFGALGVITALGAGIKVMNGISGRIDPSVEAIFTEKNNRNSRISECHKGPPAEVPGCIYGGSELGVIVIGDSHAASLVRSVEKVLPINSHVLDWTYSSCVTLQGVRFKDPNYGDYCGQFLRQIAHKVKSMARQPMLIVNRYSAYLHGPNDVGREIEFGKVGIFFDKPYEHLEPDFLSQWRKIFVDTACDFAKTRPLYMLRPIPELRQDVPYVMGRAALLGKNRRVSISLEEYHERNRLVWEAQDAASAQCGIHILDPLPYLCSDGRCWGDKDGLPLYYDDDHLSERGGALLQPLFATMFRD